MKTSTSTSPKRSVASKTKKGKKVDFEYFAPSSVKVSVVGSFNGWDFEKHPMKNDGQGRWTLSLVLPVGRYEYRYSVDGTWQNDQRPVECIPNAFGTWNCVLEVS